MKPPPDASRNLRQNPVFLFVRLPYLLSFLCIVVGVIWLLLLPLNEYSRRTYISENALLPGQVHAYFSGSEQHIFRGYKKEIESLVLDPNGDGERRNEDGSPVAATTEGFGQGGEKDAQVSEKVRSIFRAAGLKVATQNYEYTSAGNVHRGQNTYAIINAPRGDATEAIVLVAAWKTVEDELNINGITLALTLARYFRRMFLPFFFFSLFGTSWWVELLMVDRLVSVVEGYYIPDHA